MTYNPEMTAAQDVPAWPVISSPYITENLHQGILLIDVPGYPYEEINLRKILQLTLP